MVDETDDFAGFHSHAIIFVALKTTFYFLYCTKKGSFVERFSNCSGNQDKPTRGTGQSASRAKPVSFCQGMGCITQ